MSTGGKGSDGEDQKGGSFADLVTDDTRPIDRGPKKIRATTQGKTTKPRAAAGSKAAAFRWPDPTERLRAAAAGVSDEQLLALGRGDPEPEEQIDLHGTRRDQAKRLLAKRIESARAQGKRSLVVIHGRGQNSATGEAILRDALPDWLSRGSVSRSVLAFAPAPDRLGGRGATMILLRRAR